MSSSDKNTIGPYFNTTMTTIIGLHPNQMTRRIYENLKTNLIEKYSGKNFESYGFISKIYNLTKREGGFIVAENSLSPAMFKVEFLCKLCRPLKGTTIVCEVQIINKIAILLKNGPIDVYIFFDEGNQINSDVFSYDDATNVHIGKTMKRGKPSFEKIVVGSFVNIKCLDTRIESSTNRIIVWGTMESVASEKDISTAISQRESDDIPTVSYETYIMDEISEEAPVDEHTTADTTTDDQENQDGGEIKTYVSDDKKTKTKKVRKSVKH